MRVNADSYQTIKMCLLAVYSPPASDR
jgi:hypothetical protein